MSDLVNMKFKIEEKLEKGHEIRPFPTAVNRLINAIQDPKSNSDTISEIIELDVALSTRILRMVNSPLYGLANQIQSIKRAVTILGLSPLRNFALSFAGATMMTGTEKTRKHCTALWNHSLGCATVARTMANKVSSVNADAAFLAGIFHDIGKLFLLDVFPTEYAKIIDTDCGRDLLVKENSLFGMSHTDIGLRLTVAWPLPDEIKGVVMYHHDPSADSKQSELTRLVHVADRVARTSGIGSSTLPLEPTLEQADEFFGLDEDAILSVRQESHLSFAETKQLFSV